MRVEYTRPAVDDAETSTGSTGNGHAPAGRNQESPARAEDEQPGSDSRPTAG
jgi:hypothetical protein